MAKIAYFGIPAHGHTNPTLAVVRELAVRGHEVLYYNAESFRAKVESTGVSFRAYPEPMPTERELSEAMRDLINASLILSAMSERLTPFVLDEMAREAPDLILYDSTAMPAYIAARTLHIPHICLFTTFVLESSISTLGAGALLRFMGSAIPHLRSLMRWKARMAAQYGKDIAGGITENGDLNLVFTSQEFQPKSKSIDERFRFVGASIEPATRDGDFPFEALGSEPVVYISLGTINHLDTAFYRTAFEAFADYPARFVLAAGKNTDLAALGEIPANFTVRAYVPQLSILQRSAAFITHGGMNSVHEGLYYGVPEIVVPHQMEQLLNGKRVAETGAGVLLGSRYPYGRVTAAELRGALETILGDAHYRQRAEAIGETLKAAGGYQGAVDEIERFIGVQEASAAQAA